MGPHPFGPARLTTRDRELYVEIPGETSLELVDRALLAALLSAGLCAEKEGPRVATMVRPAICYGKVRVAARGETFVRDHLHFARSAAIEVLRTAGFEVMP